MPYLAAIDQNQTQFEIYLASYDSQRAETSNICLRRPYLCGDEPLAVLEDRVHGPAFAKAWNEEGEHAEKPQDMIAACQSDTGQEN